MSGIKQAKSAAVGIATCAGTLLLATLISAGNALGASTAKQLTTDGGNAIPRFSPDGNHIAYTHVVSESDYDVYVIKSDGSGRRQLTSGPSEDRVGGWSPDGSKIAFSSNTTGIEEIFTINSDGSGLQQVSDLAGEDIGIHGVESLAYHPLQDVIFFSTNVHGHDGYCIYKLIPATKAHSPFFCYNGIDAKNIAISPNGSSYVVANRDREKSTEEAPFAYLLRSDRIGTNLGLLFHDQDVSYNFPAFAGDSRIGFTSIGSSGGKPYMYVYLRDLDGSRLVQLTKSGDWAAAGFQDFSRDGQQVAFAAWLGGGPFAFSKLNLYLDSVEGLNPVRVRPQEKLKAALRAGKKVTLLRLLAGKATVKAKCSEACTGTLTMRLKGRKARRSAYGSSRGGKGRTPVIARVKVRIPQKKARKFKKFKVKLRKRQRRLLRRKLRRGAYRGRRTKRASAAFRLKVISTDRSTRASRSKRIKLLLI